MSRVLIVPAAGSGTRLNSEVPKVVTPVNGRPMVNYLIERYASYVERFVLVIRPDFEKAVRRVLGTSNPPVDIAMQAEPTGMLDAILIPRANLTRWRPDEIWITWCDQVAISENTVNRLARLRESDSDCELLFTTAHMSNPYIHLARSDDGEIIGISYAREGDEMPECGESDTGLFTMSRHAYFDLLPKFAEQATLAHGTGERNFLPFITWLRGRGRVRTIEVTDPIEALGINTPGDLLRIEEFLSGP